MTDASFIRPGIALLCVPLLATLLGCQTVTHHPPGPGPVVSGCEPPRELSMVSLPDHRLAPPDIVQIQMLKMVPRYPYRVQLQDVLQIAVAGTLPDQPLDGIFVVEPDGTVNLGLFYGRIAVAGLTVEEIRETLWRHLSQSLRQPQVMVQLAQIADLQPLTGTYLVHPDGKINLLRYGSVRVAGMSLFEAKCAIERQLAPYFEAPEVWLDIVAYNSQVYYIVTQGANLGDNVVRIPVTGNETVLDAIAQIQGLSQVSSTKIWIARPAPGNVACEQILPVNWEAITRGGATATNYQILPGDRVFIAQDEMIAFTNGLGKILGPFERVFGFGSLTSTTIRSFKNLGSDNVGGGF